jgi:hypothetical protein
MKKLNILLSVILAVLVAGCSGSETYRGDWKATNSDGAKFELSFEAKSFTLKDSTGNIKNFEYTQNFVKIDGAVKTYGIKLDDGRAYQINFPNADDESQGFMRDGNGYPIYTISRKGYVKSEDIYKLE